MTDLSTEEIAAFHLCHQCIGEEYYSEEVKKNGKSRTCYYCKERKKGVRIGEAADRIEGILEQHFQPTAAEPNSMQWQMMKDRESTYDFYPDGDPTNMAILNLADIPDEAANHIQLLLHERHGDWDMWASGETTPYADDLHYEEAPIDDAHWHMEWRAFEHTLKTETRYFNRDGDDLLSRIFEGIDKLRTPDGKSLIVEAGPDTSLSHFHRARSFEDDASLKDAMMHPETRIGPPPANVSTSGRMNAQGVAVFYGATEPQVAIAEIRPAVGSQVLLGRFDLVRPLRLLDLSRLNDVARSGSLFDSVFSTFLERAKFLQSFTQQMTRPVMPSHVALDYLPTQAVADFLASMESPALDGILYPSVQSGQAGLNVVLFHKASRVAELGISEGAELEAETWQMYEEGPQREYRVIEWLPEETSDDGPQVAPDNMTADHNDVDWPSTTERAISLRISRDALQVRIIQQTTFVTDDNDVDHMQTLITCK